MSHVTFYNHLYDIRTMMYWFVSYSQLSFDGSNLIREVLREQGAGLY